MNFPLFPTQASTTAPRVDALYWFLIGMSVFFLAIIFLPMIFFLFKYRRTKQVDRTMPYLPQMGIEITWTVIPLFLVTGIFVWATRLYFDMQRVPDGAIEVNVVGKQWMWKVQHAEGRSEINELHVPAGQTIKVTLASQDVIHSFFLPAFRIKQDVVPGRYTTEWFTATRPGTYHIFCAEYCGKDHSHMRGRVVVMKPDEFEDWLRRGATGETLVQRGGRLFMELGCSGCHFGSSVVRAPRLEGIFGTRVPLSDGTFVTADEKYIRDSILLPNLQIAAGYQPLMPTFQGRVTEEELLQLIAYIKNLRPLEEIR